jgi:opacity protein-like surface antigen
LNWGGAAANYNPYVDDGYLGWEAGLGVDWKLLENFSSKLRYAYWQPGQWFDQAYRVIGLQGGAVNANAQMSGRSAIQAFEASVVVDF